MPSGPWSYPVTFELLPDSIAPLGRWSYPVTFELLPDSIAPLGPFSYPVTVDTRLNTWFILIGGEWKPAEMFLA